VDEDRSPGPALLGKKSIEEERAKNSEDCLHTVGLAKSIRS